MSTEFVPALHAEGLSKRYGGALALEGFDLTLAAGQVVALVGHNGAGKSTASKIIAGFVAPDEGTLHVGGTEVEHWTPKEASRLGIALVPQQFAVVPELTIEENITLGHNVPRDMLRSVAEALQLQDVLKAGAADVSPATHRLTMIGRALVRKPKVIILDEPTAAFSSAETDLLFAVVERLKGQGIAFIYVSHRLQEVLDISDRVLGMSSGRIILDRPSSELTKDSLADIISGSHATLSGGQNSERAQLRETVGAREVLVRVRKLSTRGKLRKLHDVSFDVHKGEVLGITGLIGAGRSSLLNTIWGMYGAPEVEDFELLGRPFTPRSPKDSVKRRIAYVPEGRVRTSVVPDLDVTENVTLATLRSGAGAHNPFISKSAEVKTVSDVLSTLDTKPAQAASMHVGELSGGNQQKVVIARWLLSDAQVYMFDEPSEGVDIAARREIYRAVRELASQGCAVIVSSSDIEEVVEFADRILIMRDGTITEEVPGEKQNVEYVSRACL